MKQQLKKLHQAHKQGSNAFTIIEVMIVLAIAGIIMVIVFLAVPALQRNSRNTQRTNDATRIAAAVNECIANNNGRIANCNNLAAAQMTNYITLTDNQQLTAATGSGISSVSYTTGGNKCNAAGTDNTGAAGGVNSFTIRYQLETNGAATQQRCIGS